MFSLYAPILRFEVSTRQAAFGFLQIETSGLPRLRRLVWAVTAVTSMPEPVANVPATVAPPRYPPRPLWPAGSIVGSSRSVKNTRTLAMPAVGSDADALGSQAMPVTHIAPRRKYEPLCG